MIDEETYKHTSQKMAAEGYKLMLEETRKFINSNSLEMFGAGISGIGLPDYKLAEMVLDFIYEQNCKEDLRVIKEMVNEEKNRL